MTSRPAAVSENGSPTVFINGIPACRLGDFWREHCDVTFGSTTVYINALPAARLGDPVACESHSHITDGSPNVNFGG